MKRNTPSRRPHYRTSTQTLRMYRSIAHIAFCLCVLFGFIGFCMAVLAAGTTDFMIENSIVDPIKQSAVDSMTWSSFVLFALSCLGSIFCRKTRDDLTRIICKRNKREAMIRKRIAMENRKSVRPAPLHIITAAL